MLQPSYNEQFFSDTIEALRSGHAGWGTAGYLFMDLGPEEEVARTNALKNLGVTEEELEQWRKRRVRDNDEHFRLMSMM